MVSARVSARLKIALVFFAFAAISVYLIEGSYYEDEIGQVSAFAAYKFGQINAGEMRWEFHAQMRPWLQPAIYFFLEYPFWLAGGYNYPLFEKISLLFQFFLLLLVLPPFVRRFAGAHERGHVYLLYFATLWFLPGMLVRHSSDALSAIALLFSVLVLHAGETEKEKSVRRALVAGLIAGLAFHIRYQVAFFFLGYACTRLTVAALQRQFLANLKQNAFFSAGVMVGLSLGIAVDFWGYGKPVLAAYNYAWQNIALKKAADFGRESWYWYFPQVVAYTGNPLIWMWFLAAIYVARKDAFLIALSGGIVFFLAAHCAVDHKEVRFLLPMLGPFSAVFFQTLPAAQRLGHGRWQAFWRTCYSPAVLRFVVVLNLILLIFFTVVGSARDKFRISAALWNLPADTLVYSFTNLYARFDGAFARQRQVPHVGVMPFAKPPHIRLFFAETREYDSACRRNPSAYILLTGNDAAPDGLQLIEKPLRSAAQFPPEIFWNTAEWQRRMWRFKLVRCADLAYRGRDADR